MAGGRDGLKRFEAEACGRSMESEEMRFVGSGAEGQPSNSRPSGDDMFRRGFIMEGEAEKGARASD